MYGSLTTAGLFPETGFQMFFALHFHPVAGFSPLPPVLTSSGACLLSPGGGVPGTGQGPEPGREGQEGWGALWDMSELWQGCGRKLWFVVEMRLAERSVSGLRSWKEE